MHHNAIDMLKRLNPAVRPLPPNAAEGAAPFEARAFDDLLTLVARQGMATGRPVSIDPGLDLDLDEPALERLGAAADTAEAAGFRNALILDDGRALALDVTQRLIRGQITPGASPEAIALDGAVVTTSAGAGTEPGLELPNWRSMPARVAEQIERARRHDTHHKSE